MLARRSTYTAFLSLVVLLVCALCPRWARADRTTLVHVVALDSDDASEDQADALSAALRARVRNTPGWQTAESNQSLSTLLPALKCPTRPDAACLQRIGDQLKTDRFFWGSVTKAPAHQVVAEVHLWARGKPEQVAKETYSDNLKDQNDEALRRVAAQLFSRLTGLTAQGTLIVKAPGTDKGAVLVDGAVAGQLDHGQATLLVSTGLHHVDVQVEGMTSTPQSVTVTAAAQSEVSIAVKAGQVVGPPETGPSKPFPIKKVVGFSSLGVGLAMGVVSAVLAASWAGGMSDWDKFRTGKSDPSNLSLPAQQLCTPGSAAYTAYSSLGVQAACDKAHSATTEGTVAWIMGGVGVGLIVVGAVLVFTDHPKTEEGPPAAARLRVLPTFGPNSAGIDALVTF